MSGSIAIYKQTLSSFWAKLPQPRDYKNVVCIELCQHISWTHRKWADSCIVSHAYVLIFAMATRSCWFFFCFCFVSWKKNPFSLDIRSRSFLDNHRWCVHVWKVHWNWQQLQLILQLGKTLNSLINLSIHHFCPRDLWTNEVSWKIISSPLHVQYMYIADKLDNFIHIFVSFLHTSPI